MVNLSPREEYHSYMMAKSRKNSLIQFVENE